MTKQPEDEFFQRYEEYMAQGYEAIYAHGLAALEEHIKQWPSGWGDDFVALVYGNFDPPLQPLEFKRLGITIEPDRLTDTYLKLPSTVLRARVSIPDKTLASVKDAIKKLNNLVGVLSYSGQGTPIRWHNWLTDPGWGIPGYRIGDGSPELVLELLELLPKKVLRKVEAALYWLRDPRGMLFEFHHSNLLAVFAGYWNSFELLVEAADKLSPYTNEAEKQKAIDKRLEERGGSLSPEDVSDLYFQVLRFRPKAKHAIRTCTNERADDLIKQCFEYEPRDRRLSEIRNAINHGSLDVHDPETAMMVEARFPKLWELVFNMLQGVLKRGLETHASSR